MKCCDLYKSLKNPLYDNEILEDIVDTYSNSSNFSEGRGFTFSFT